METTIQGLLAVSIIKLVLDFIANMQTGKKIDSVKKDFECVHRSIVEVCTIIKMKKGGKDD